jgi:hypothetical protein
MNIPQQSYLARLGLKGQDNLKFYEARLSIKD